MKDRKAAMDEVRQAVEGLTDSPLYAFRRQNGCRAVTGEGSLEAKIMIIGEAPGASEAKSGRPFMSAAGRLLTGLRASVGLERLYAPILSRQIEIIRPKVIVTLECFAMDFILDLLALPLKGELRADMQVLKRFFTA